MTASGRVMDAWRRASLVLLGAGATGVVALHVLRSDLPAASHRISEYALGPYGWVMAGAFAAIGAGLLALGRVVVAAGGRMASIAGILVLVAGTGMVVAGAFRTGPERSGATTDAVHSASSAAATLALTVAALVWSARPPRRVDVATVLALASVVLAMASPSLHRSDWTGFSQRALWAVLLGWAAATARRPVPRQPDVNEPSVAAAPVHEPDVDCFDVG